MYLSILSEDEKRLFFGLAYGIAVSDGNYSTEEQVQMEVYSQEMQMKFDEASMVKPIDSVIEELGKISDLRAKKIIVYEAIGLAMVDHNFDDGEREIVKKMERVFNLPQGFAGKCEIFLNDYFVLQNNVNNLVLQ